MDPRLPDNIDTEFQASEINEIYNFNILDYVHLFGRYTQLARMELTVDFSSCLHRNLSERRPSELKLFCLNCVLRIEEITQCVWAKWTAVICDVNEVPIIEVKRARTNRYYQTNSKKGCSLRITDRPLHNRYLRN